MSTAGTAAKPLDHHSVLLFPSHVKPAPKHYEPTFTPIWWTYTAIFNAMRVPVTQVPLSGDEDKLPLGVQVVCGEGLDHVSIAVANMLESTGITNTL
jgi:fatty acid amide hydrolase 2